MCSLASSVSHTAFHCNHPDSSSLVWDWKQTVWIRRSPADINVSGSDEAWFAWFQMLLLIISLAWSSLPFCPSVCLLLLHLLSLFHFLFCCCFFPVPWFLSYFKIPFLALIFFLSCFPVGIFFFSPPCESPFCSTVATQNGSAVWAEALGKRSVRWRGKKGEAESLQGCRLEVVHFPLSSCLALNRSRIWSLHI